MSTSIDRTASDAFLEALNEGGVDVAFAVFGTDHAGLIESWSKHAASSGMPSIPKLVLCQHESVAINGALGYAHFSGRCQAVIAHVDVGTLNLGAGLHNSARNRLPVFIFAGISPWSELGERFGGRDHYVHWMQDVFDQHGSVRQYVKWDYEVRSGKVMPASVARGLQMANSRPRGAVYMTAGRETLEESVSDEVKLPPMPKLDATVPTSDALDEIVNSLRSAKAPLLLTTALGAEEGAVSALVEFAETYGVAVVEIRPYYTNMPADHKLHQGYYTDAKIDLLRDADLIISADCPVPWIPTLETPREDAFVLWMGEDPSEIRMPMRTMHGHKFIQCNTRATLEELTLRGKVVPIQNIEAFDARIAALTKRHNENKKAKDEEAQGSELTVARLARLVADICGDQALIINETVTNDTRILRQLAKNEPGRLMGEAGSGLGMGLSAALGAKLARPDSDVVCLQGDGAYIFGSPSAVHWGASSQKAPFLTIIFNNGGWRAVARSTAMIHPQGHAARAEFPEGRFEYPLDLEKIVEAAGGVGIIAATIQEAEDAILRGLEMVRSGKQVVINAKVSD